MKTLLKYTFYFYDILRYIYTSLATADGLALEGASQKFIENLG